MVGYMSISLANASMFEHDVKPNSNCKDFWSLIGAKREAHLEIERRVGSHRGHITRATQDAGGTAAKGRDRGEEQFRYLTHPGTVYKKSVFSFISSTLYFIFLRYETRRGSRKIENGVSIFFASPSFSGTSIT